MSIHFYSRLAAAILLTGAAWAADSRPEQKLIQLARQNPGSPAFLEELDRQIPAEKRKDGAGVTYGPDLLWVVSADAAPMVSLDDERPVAMQQAGNSRTYCYLARVATGRSHALEMTLHGKPFGKRTDLAAYGPDSYPQPGVPQGKLSEKKTHTSQIYPGMVSEYWVYVSPGYDPQKGAALMVWQDGQNYARENSATRLITVTENLIQQKKIPPMIHVMIAPGKVGERPMRSVEYDEVSDRYPRFLLEEILPEVEKTYRIRKDAYSRAIGGESSGGICAFTAAWTRNDQFSRVLSRIGSYTSIEWNHHRDRDPKKDVLGGNAYPFMVRKDQKRNIRVWLQDGNYDLENEHGSWPLQNIQMANSLKMKGYDFRFSFGNAQHNTAHGNAELPEALTWLWRDYDPQKTEQTYEMDPAEKDRPYYRVRIANR